MKNYPKEVELLVYYASGLTVASIIGLIQRHITKENAGTILAENYGRKVDNFSIRLVIEGDKDKISEAVEELKQSLTPHAKRVSLVRLEDTEFEPPTPYEKLTHQ